MEATSIKVLLTQPQRQAVADSLPNLADRLKLEEENQRTIRFSLEELREIRRKAGEALPHAKTGMKRNSLRHVLDIVAKAIEDSQGFLAIPSVVRLYQFKVTLLGSQPPIWRRIQTADCTLDKLHEHIQTSMGWTNSHLHQFEIQGKHYADPDLWDAEFELVDSTKTNLSQFLPKSGKRFSFTYEYDFGDGWEHDVLFEGCPQKEPGQRYPLCLEGERACPPEDCGGIGGFYELLEALANPKHEEHDNMLEWIGGSFDPAKFDAKRATKEMKKGLPDWRSMR